MDRAQLADFLRTRREALQPEDVGLPRGPRRRTGGLRREEVAALCGMSADYYSRIEQQRGPNPSEQMLAAIARGLHLTLEERDHLLRLAGYTWFTDPAARRLYPEIDHPMHGRAFTARLRETYTREGKGSRAAAIVDALLAASPEFAQVWRAHDISVPHSDLKRIQHPQVGVLELNCQTLVDPDQSQVLLVFTAVPGTESYEKLRLLSIIGDSRIDA